MVPVMVVLPRGSSLANQHHGCQQDPQMSFAETGAAGTPPQRTPPPRSPAGDVQPGTIGRLMASLVELQAHKGGSVLKGAPLRWVTSPLGLHHLTSGDTVLQSLLCACLQWPAPLRPGRHDGGGRCQAAITGGMR